MARTLGAIARQLERLERAKRRADFGPEAVAGRSPHQLAYVASQAKRILSHAGRRSGKTRGGAYRLHLAALTPPAAPVGYITLTRESAREIIWDDLLEINDHYGLGGKVNHSRLTITHRFGRIGLYGCDNQREIRKIRGHKFKEALIDECQSIAEPILKPLLTRDLRPTLIDYQGRLVLAGTGPAARVGRWFEMAFGNLRQNFEVHHWTFRENPYLPAYEMGMTADQIVAEILKEEGWTEQNPTFLREYGGLAVDDLDVRLYQYESAVNDFDGELPAGDWMYTIGIDLGSKDRTAVWVWGWRRHDPTLYQVYEYEHAGLVKDPKTGRERPIIVDDVLRWAWEAIKRFPPVKAVVDQGGLGLMIADTLRERGLPVEAAQKNDKGAHIKLFNSDLRKGAIKVRADSAFARDAQLVEKDPKAFLHDKLQEREHGYHSDILDAALYSWRAALHWLQKPAPEPKTLPDKMREDRFRKVAKQKTSLRDDDDSAFRKAMGYED